MKERKTGRNNTAKQLTLVKMKVIPETRVQSTPQFRYF